MKLRIGAILAGLVLLGAACTPPGGGGTPNTPPTAILVAAPTSGNAPLLVDFDGSASTDANGTIINHFWDFGDGNSTNGALASHTYATPGTYTAQLLVTDNQGAVATDSVTIVVTNDPPTAAFTASPTSGAAPLSVNFDGTISTDPNGPISSYAWDFEELGTATGATTTKVFPPGTYTVTLTVTDPAGATDTATQVVTATGTPAAPTGLTHTGSGCCDTYGDYSWNIVPGADGYEINMDGYFLGGCVTDHSDVVEGQVSTGRVQAVGLCLGSQYDVSIRARANGVWGPWSSTIHITL